MACAPWLLHPLPAPHATHTDSALACPAAAGAGPRLQRRPAPQLARPSAPLPLYPRLALLRSVLWLSGFVFSVVFGVIAWVSVDSQSLANQWPLAFVMIACIISPIVGIAMALLFSTILNGDLFNSPIDGLIAGLLFGSIAHALMRFMEQLILDLVDAAFMCFAIDTHNGIISPRGEVVHRFMGATFGDQLTDSAKAQPTVAAGAKGPTPDVMPPPVAGAAAVSTHKYNA